MEESIRKYALENAIKHRGKATPGAIVGKLINENPKIKKDMKNISKKINEIIKKVNDLTVEKQEKELLKLDPNYFKDKKESKEKRKEERKELPELKDAIEGKVVTRIAPEPSKYNHLGHAVSFLLNYMNAEKYKGKCIMRFDDTNPEKESQEYVDAMNEDVLNYLDIKPSETVFASDYNDDFIKKAEQLIKDNLAYTCDCKEISKYRRDMKDCKHKSQDIETIKKEWEDMKNGKEGQVLRLKISMQHKNAVMRDPVIFRVINTKHYRQKDKYKVWPMYDFECSLLEGMLKVTHVLRSNEFDSRIELQNHIREIFNLPNPIIKQYARFNVTGSTTKGREIRELIETGDYIGWDDPRLITLRALKRRGITKEAFYELSKVMGMSKTTSNLDFSVLSSINRKILDSQANRYFFIENPIEIKIKKAEDMTINLLLHPDYPKRGKRIIKTTDEYYIENKDLNNIKDKETIRLMDALNITKDKEEFIKHSISYEEFKVTGTKIIHWLPKKDTIKVEIRMPDNKVLEGLGETNLNDLKENDIIQFERFGFVRLDKKLKTKLQFWFTHK